ncbi:PleD family two-component system response regulator, partial [Rhodoblastus acidophilus]
VVSLGLESFDALRLCSQLRSLDRTRNVPILAIADPEEESSRLNRGLEIGVNEYVFRPVDRNELLARARTQVRKRRFTERLRDNVTL